MDIIIMDILDLEASIWWWYVSVRVLLWFGCFQGGVGIWPSSLHCQPFGVYFLAPLWWRFLIYSVIYLSKKKRKRCVLKSSIIQLYQLSSIAYWSHVSDFLHLKLIHIKIIILYCNLPLAIQLSVALLIHCKI